MCLLSSCGAFYKYKKKMNLLVSNSKSRSRREHSPQKKYELLPTHVVALKLK